METHEIDWIRRRVLPILTDRRHIADTTDLINRVLPPSQRFRSEFGDPIVRWPGYLGPKVVPGQCVLVIGNVHREMKSGALLGDADGVVQQTYDATARMQSMPEALRTDADSESYLAQHGSAYEAGLGGAWNIGRIIAKGLEACEVSPTPEGVREIVYINASCCQIPEDDQLARPGWAKRMIVRRCLEQHDLATVVRLLKPRVILSWSAPAYDYLDAAGSLRSFANVCVHQRRQTMIRKSKFGGTAVDPVKGIKVDLWTEMLKKAHKTS